MANEANDNTLLNPLDEAMNTFKKALEGGQTKNIGALWRAWHYLQVYSVWGIHLPNDSNTLASTLGIKKPLEYDFFPKMLSSYVQIYTASTTFNTQVFPQLTNVGESLRSFGKEAKVDEDGLFGVLLEMLSDKDASKTDIRDLIVDFQQKARDNADQAGQVNKLLQTYADQLSDAKVALAKADKSIADDDLLSKQTVTLLDGPADKEGSLAYIRQKIKDYQAEYKQDVIVASTTVTYGWIPIIGNIAAVVVAGIFGKKATTMLGEIDKANAALKTAEHIKQVAVKTRSIQQKAKAGVDQASEYTGYAIEQVGIVQQAWNGVDKSLGLVVQKLDKMTTNVGGEAKKRANSKIKTFLRRAAEQWQALWPAIETLTTNPYIVVEDGEISVTQLIDKVNQEIQASNT